MSKDFKKIIYSLHPLERKVLPFVEFKSIDKISKESSLCEAEVTTGLQLLEQKGYVKLEQLEQKFVGLDKFGEKFINSDLPEIAFLKEIITSEKKQSEIKLEKEQIGAALGILKKIN